MYVTCAKNRNMDSKNRNIPDRPLLRIPPIKNWKMSLEDMLILSWLGFNCFCLGYAAVRLLLSDYNCSNGENIGFSHQRPGLIRCARNDSVSLLSDRRTDAGHSDSLPEDVLNTRT